MDYDSSYNSWVNENEMSCPKLWLEFRVENGHGRRITAVQAIDGAIKYRVQWGDGSHSIVDSGDAMMYWPRLLFDFLVGKTKWRMPEATYDLNNRNWIQINGNSNNVAGKAVKVLCKCIFCAIIFDVSVFFKYVIKISNVQI